MMLTSNSWALVYMFCFLADISNVEYRSGKAEDWISWICRIVRTDDVVAILDPPRGGLGKLVYLFH